MRRHHQGSAEEKTQRQKGWRLRPYGHHDGGGAGPPGDQLPDQQEERKGHLHAPKGKDYFHYDIPPDLCTLIVGRREEDVHKAQEIPHQQDARGSDDEEKEGVTGQTV